MDATAELLANYTASLRFEHLPEDVVWETKRRVIDTVGCAMGGLQSKPYRIARDLALNTSSSNFCATVIGTRSSSSADLAAFANSAASRYLDYNDTHLTRTSSHPSDVILPLAAVAEAVSADGRALITAVVLAYEVLCRLTDATDMWAKGWDYSTLGALSTALGAASLLRLNRRQIANAASLALCPNIVLRQTRVGAITDWKVCAFPNGCRNGIFAALLARGGLSAPLEPFQGKGGFCSQVSGDLNLQPFATAGGHFKLLDTSLKLYPACYLTQTAIEATLDIRGDLQDGDPVQHILIQAGFRAIDDTADTPDKWNPTNIFTANNSLPFTVAVTIQDGKLDQSSFSQKKLQDRKLKDLVGRIQVREKEEFSQAPGDSNPVLLEVTTESGAIHSRQVAYAKGHPRNPASDADVEAKFWRLAARRVPRAKAKALLVRLWCLEQEDRLSEVIELLASDRGPRVLPNHIVRHSMNDEGDRLHHLTDKEVLYHVIELKL